MILTRRFATTKYKVAASASIFSCSSHPQKRFISSNAPPSSLLDDVDKSTAIVEGAMKLGDLKAHGLCKMTPSGLLETVMEYAHVGIGLPWWLTIVASTISIRLLISPLNIGAIRNSSRLQVLQPEVKEIMSKYSAAKANGDMKSAQEHMGSMMALYEKNGVNPVKSILPVFITAPIFMSFFFALRDIAALPLQSLKTGGLYWFTDLTLPDPYYALPVLATGAFFYVLENGLETGGKTATNAQSKTFKNAFRIMAIGGLPIMAQFPAALSLYWFTNSVFTIAFTTALQRPAMRKILDLPQIVPQPDVSKEIAPKPEEAKMPGFMESASTSIAEVMRKNPDHPLVKALQKKQEKLSNKA